MYQIYICYVLVTDIMYTGIVKLFIIYVLFLKYVLSYFPNIFIKQEGRKTTINNYYLLQRIHLYNINTILKYTFNKISYTNEKSSAQNIHFVTVFFI